MSPQKTWLPLYKSSKLPSICGKVSVKYSCKQIFPITKITIVAIFSSPACYRQGRISPHLSETETGYILYSHISYIIISCNVSYRTKLRGCKYSSVLPSPSYWSSPTPMRIAACIFQTLSFSSQSVSSSCPARRHQSHLSCSDPRVGRCETFCTGRDCHWEHCNICPVQLEAFGILLFAILDVF